MSGSTFFLSCECVLRVITGSCRSAILCREGGISGVFDPLPAPPTAPTLSKCIWCNSSVCVGRGEGGEVLGKVKVAIPGLPPSPTLFVKYRTNLGTSASVAFRRRRCRRGGITTRLHRTPLKAFNTSSRKSAPYSHPRVAIRIFLAVHLKTRKEKKKEMTSCTKMKEKKTQNPCYALEG